MLIEELSEKWEKEKLEAMSIDTSFEQLTCDKGQEREMNWQLEGEVESEEFFFFKYRRNSSMFIC